MFKTAPSFLTEIYFMVPILIYPMKLPYDSHLSTFIIERGKGLKKKQTLLVLGNRIKFRVVTLESDLIPKKEIISM